MIIFLPLVLVSALHGLALYPNCQDVMTFDADWTYNWSTNPYICRAETEAIPMIWGAGSVEQLRRGARVFGDWTLGGTSEWVMGFNEPEAQDQSNLTSDQAAALWHEIETELQDRKLVSPAMSWQETLGWNGTPWLVEFREAYRTHYGAWPRMDAIAVHCYSDPNTCKAVVDIALTWAAAWGAEGVWLSEFGFPDCAAWGGTDDALVFMNEMVNYCRQHNIRYAWFSNRLPPDAPWWTPYFPYGCTPALIDWNTGVPTALGQRYIGLR